MTRSVSDGMMLLIEKLMKDQSPDGSWKYPFETGISTDCYMIILLRTLEIDDEILIKQLTERIVSKQEANGAWKLFHDEGNGNLSITIEAYYGLSYSTYIDRKDPRLIKAKRFILANGGIEKSHMLTKLMLAITGQLKWPTFFPLPLELILLPPAFPINFYSFSVFGRANFTPLMILADRKFSLQTDKSPNVSDLFVSKDRAMSEDPFRFKESKEWCSLFSHLKASIERLIGIPSDIHKLAVEQAKQYMLNRIEPDGTFYNIFSSTFLMIYALLSLGYEKTHSTIENAVNGLKGMITEINGLPHMQYTTAEIWNTSLINYALLEAGVSPQHPMVKKANQFLIDRQHYKFGDWIVHNPTRFPGGWGFQEWNTIQPDVDDTTATLRAISKNGMNDSHFIQSWERGLQWVLSMQNEDGGWPAFERNTDSKLLKKLPIEKAKFIVADPAAADLTGRTLEFLGNFANLKSIHPKVHDGIHWLFRNQEADGSWYGRWGICYLYGTWAAITGLIAVGTTPQNQAISKAVKWLNQIQNEDGGWGEACKSDIEGKYIPLYESILTQTAWAVDALIAASDEPTRAIKKGMKFLLNKIENEDWTTDYPVGQGMGGDFYIHYHSYRYIFPLLAFSHYKRKYFDE